MAAGWQLIFIYRRERDELEAVKKFPVILAQIPYGKSGLAVLADYFVRAGYALVLVDVRGRYDSEGEFNFVTLEEEDGPEIVAWITRQDWYDKNAGIGLLGISYLLTAGLSAAACCEAVKTLVNVGGVADFSQLAYRGGALSLHHVLPWSIIVSPKLIEFAKETDSSILIDRFF